MESDDARARKTGIGGNRWLHFLSHRCQIGREREREREWVGRDVLSLGFHGWVPVYIFLFFPHNDPLIFVLFRLSPSLFLFLYFSPSFS